VYPTPALQTNTHDCGVFVLAHVESLILRGKVDFDQTNIQEFRVRLLLQVAKCVLQGAVAGSAVVVAAGPDLVHLLRNATRSAGSSNN
jgi:hypothetical protein